MLFYLLYGMSNTRNQQELWEIRQMLYRLHGIQGITAWKAKDILTLYELFEEYNLLDILDTNNTNDDDGNNNSKDVIAKLLEIKDSLNEKIKVASKDKDFKAKAILAKKLDKVLILIALVEAENKEGLMRITSMYKLLNRYEELRNALANDNDNSNSIEAITDKIMEELERKIIELKKVIQ